MVVAINQPRQQQQFREPRTREETGLDKLLKALNIANAGMGIAVNYNAIGKQQADTARSKALTAESEARTAGIPRKLEADVLTAEAKLQEAESRSELRGKQIEKAGADIGIQERQQTLKENKFSFEKQLKDQDAGIKKKIRGEMKPSMRLIHDRIKNPAQRKEAIKELGIRQNLREAEESIGNTYDLFRERGISITGSLPFSDKSAALAAGNAKIEAAIAANWKGLMTEPDRKNIVVPLLPVVDDTQGQIDAKQEQMFQLLRTQSPGTPTLDGFGIGTNDEIGDTEKLRSNPMYNALKNRAQETGKPFNDQIARDAILSSGGEL